MPRLVSGLLLLFLAAPAPAPAPAGAEELRLPRDPAELEAFFDGLLPALMETHHIPGAVLAVVSDGRALLQKGYGYADFESRRPVDPETTVFRLASVSKLVTSTAAMQLVHAGKLDLHADVNTYLEAFQLEATYDEPVTLHHLLTHTGGFDDRFLRSGFELGSELPALENYLAARMPPRVMPPGQRLSYSNHGLALVGHLVERASGQSFDEYVQAHVFDPLEMRNTRFGLASPPEAGVAVGYEWKNGRHADIGYDHTLLGPAAELRSTAADMARFMIAHLQEGRLGERRILETETARLMHARHFSHDPRLPGWCYGFAEGDLGGVRTIGHGGSWRGFRTLLLLEPESQVGIFVSLNSEFTGPLWQNFEQAVARFLVHPAPAPKLTPPADFGSRADRYTGSYIPNRRMRGTILKVAQFIQAVEVSASEDGTLMLDYPGADPFHFVEIEKDWFGEAGGSQHARFFSDDQDRVTGFATGAFAMDRVPASRSPQVHLRVLVAGMALFVATLAGWLLGALARLLGGAAPSPAKKSARLVGSAACLLLVTALGGIAYSLVDRQLFDMLIEVPFDLRVLLLLPMAALPVTAVLPYFALRGFTGEGPALLARLHYWTLTLFAVAFMAMAWYWNLLGFHY